MRGCSRDTHQLGVEGGRGRNDDTTACCSTLYGLMGGARFLGLKGEVTRRVGHGAPCLSDSRLYLFRQAARNQLYPCVGRGQACPPFPASSSPSFYLGRAL